MLALLLTLVQATSVQPIVPTDSVTAMSRSLTMDVEVDDLDRRLAQTEGMVEAMGVEVLHAENNRESKWNRKASMRLAVADSLFDRLKDSLAGMGRPGEFRLEVNNSRDEIEKIALEIAFRKTQREAYAKELPSIDRAKESEVYHQTWEKTRELEESIFTLEQELLAARQRVRQNIVELSLEEASEPPSETSHAWVEFTNMPGGEYTYLSIENPKSGISANAYQGGSVRYLFTRGKSYIVLGVLKSIDAPEIDSALYTDIFQYAYGADFYPSHFGKGQRNFLNLYSGFTIGGLFLSSKTSNRSLFQVTPHVGIELFKGRQFLLDTRLGYLLPLSSKYNLNLRGWTSSTSLNFVF